MNNFKSILWTILGIVIFIAIIKFFIFMLPFVIAIGILSYIVFKWKSAVNRRKNHGESYNYYDKNSNGFEEGSIDDSTNGQSMWRLLRESWESRCVSWQLMPRRKN